MYLHTLAPAPGAVKPRKRIGRGQGSARGGTSTKGHKGAQARTGYKSKLGFEGGQTPIQRRLPKNGKLKSLQPERVILSVDALRQVAAKHEVQEISPAFLQEKKLLKRGQQYKVLAGEQAAGLSLTVRAHACSAKAMQQIIEAGGSVELV